MNILKKAFIALFHKKRRILLVLIILAVFLFIIFPFQKVKISQIGVRYNNYTGEVTDNILPGWHYVIPFLHDLTVYPVNERIYVISRDQTNWNQGIDGSITTPAKDNQTVSMDVTFIYSLERDKLKDIYERYDGLTLGEIESLYLDEVFKDAIITTVAKYNAYDVYSSKRQEIQEEVLAKLQDKYKDSGILIQSVYINKVRLSEELTSILRAEALAQAAIIEAQGKSDANKLLSESLSDKIMKYESLSKLSESLKLVVVPSGSNTDLDFANIIDQILDTGSSE